MHRHSQYVRQSFIDFWVIPAVCHRVQSCAQNHSKTNPNRNQHPAHHENIVVVYHVEQLLHHQSTENLVQRVKTCLGISSRLCRGLE